MSTIFAQATVPGRAGVAVIRVSGPNAFAACRAVTGDIPEPRRTVLRDFVAEDGARLDTGLVVVFAAPASFTGEDVVEFHAHGGVAVVSALLQRLGALPDLRLAEPGEFTRRAMSNGKLDLTQVEGLADLIDAQTEQQRKHAHSVMSGGLSSMVELWRKDLIRAAALLEAVIDFADEEVPEDVSSEVEELLTKVRKRITLQLEGWRFSERLREGFEVAIVGEPNSGKSTLLNFLAGRDAAITSEVAGTTRDVIEVQMDLDGIPVTILDTAGLRKTDDPVEQIGVSRATDRAIAADIRVFLAEAMIDEFPDFQDGDVLVHPKADLREDRDVAVSGVTGQGVDDLVAQLTQELRVRVQKASLLGRLRHVQSCEAALETINIALENLRSGSEIYDITAEDIRAVIRNLESLVGRIDVENLLDEIFSSFCLGK